jgi:hypothetical protein
MVGEAQQVTGTTAKLVQVATECQRVIANAQGSGATGQKGRAYYADGTWSEGMLLSLLTDLGARGLPVL